MKHMQKVFASALSVALAVLAGGSAEGLSLEDRELRDYIRLSPAEFPMNRAAVQTVSTVATDEPPAPVPATECRLDGTWSLSRDGLGPIPCEVPGSIHVALMKAGVIPDPNVGTNAILARLQSTEYDWTAVREFAWDGGGEGECDELCFDGVCDRCEVFLNGSRLGGHQGMFGGPVFDVTGKLRKGMNRLEVKLLRALHYTQTVVFCCSYGWHYSQVVPLGIWRSVRIRRTGRVRLDAPFVATRDAKSGAMSLYVGLAFPNGGQPPPGGELPYAEVFIRPKNFAGTGCRFKARLDRAETRFDFTVPDPRLWWPHGYGEQPLYTVETRLVGPTGAAFDRALSTFGIRDVTYEHAPAHPDFYKILVSVNGRRIFRHGANWCTMDALMRFTRENYLPLLIRAKEQGVNWLRAWGNGAVETEEFYDLCDEMGILVMQEWPTTNGSHTTQPADVLAETARVSTKRLRNHPSLIMYNGGNETVIAPDDPVIYGKMGRQTYLNDGTRPYYRQEENHGQAGYAIVHNHIRWSGSYPETYLELYGSAPNSIGEWGVDTLMNVESIVRTVGEADAFAWPIDPNGAAAYHTAMFNHFNAVWRRQDGTGAANCSYTPPPIVDKYTGKAVPDSDLAVANEYARTFFPEGSITNVETLVMGSQLAQAIATGTMIGNMRSFFPDVSSYSYYKLNDVGPNGSWALVDWYAAPKIAYWWARPFMAPVLAAVRIPTFNFHDKKDATWRIPVRLMDDHGKLSPAAAVRVRILNGRLETVATFRGGRAFDIEVNRAQIADGLRFLVAEAEDGGKVVSRTWTPLNYDRDRGSLCRLPGTTLKVDDDGKGRLRVRNVGTVPAVGVNVLCTRFTDRLHLSDNWFWLEPGETSDIAYSFDGADEPGRVLEATCSFNANPVKNGKRRENETMRRMLALWELISSQTL